MILENVFMLGFPFDISCVLFQPDENKTFEQGKWEWQETTSATQLRQRLATNAPSHLEDAFDALTIVLSRLWMEPFARNVVNTLQSNLINREQN
jgi:hypothetical protein